MTTNVISLLGAKKVQDPFVGSSSRLNIMAGSVSAFSVITTLLAVWKNDFLSIAINVLSISMIVLAVFFAAEMILWGVKGMLGENKGRPSFEKKDQ